MSQLSFDGFSASAPTPLSKNNDGASAEKPAKSTWYTGRVLSHSSISLYRTCPQKWKFKYIDKVPEKPRSFFSFGKSVHNSLEFLFSQVDKRPTLEDIMSHYKTNWISDGYETPAQEKWFYQEGDRILRGFYAKHHLDFEKILQVEYHFTMDVQGVPVTGYIDRIDKTPSGGLALLDYKTGKAFDKSRVRNDPQLTLYQMAAKQLIGKPVESVTLYHLNSLTPLTVPAHSVKLEEDLTADIVTVGKGISEEKYEPKVDEKGHCQWCDYQQICSAFAGRKPPAAMSTGMQQSLAEQVDRYAKLEAKINDLTTEKEELGQTLKAYMRESGKTELEGRHFSIGSELEVRENKDHTLQ